MNLADMKDNSARSKEPIYDLKGLRIGPWIVVDGYCACRCIAGTNPNIVKNRVAFIEKTPRVLINGQWIEGPKGTGGCAPHDTKGDEQYGFVPKSRQWCDRQLRKYGAILVRYHEIRDFNDILGSED